VLARKVRRSIWRSRTSSAYSLRGELASLSTLLGCRQRRPAGVLALRPLPQHGALGLRGADRRWLWLKLRWRGRLQTDGLCFICPGVKFEIGKDARVVLGRWSWLGDGCKIRAHEGVIEIGAKSVLGQECTLSCFQHISIGRDCIIADRVMMIDFDHGTAEVERAIREQGIYKRDVRVGHNVWIGYGASLLRGVTVGDHAVIGTSAVVTCDVPADDAVVGGIPA
jgi:acetyltransferase-like isoleucine patch superfamily enzyme